MTPIVTDPHPGLAQQTWCANNRTVIRRFQIEDIISQDSSGVVFRALDTETDTIVALRRFFPFGAEGGGLQEDEQTAYQFAISRLTAISHPGLRAVICGGCDPVDGMPFIATEWIAGAPLEDFVVRKPLTPVEAIGLLTRMMEVSELLSQVLAEEALWVEANLQAIIVGGAETGRGITFWVSPFKWIDRGNEERNLDSIITLTEDMMGWKDQSIGDQAGRGLGGWLNWLRKASKTATLQEAAVMLVVSTGIEPPMPAKSLARQAPRPAVATPAIQSRKKKSVNGTLVTIVALGLVAGGLGAWAFYRKDSDAPKPTVSLAELAAEMAAKTATSTDGITAEEKREIAAALNGKTAEPLAPASQKTGTDFTPNDPLISQQQQGSEVTVSGVLTKFSYSDSRSTMYLLFSEKPKGDEARGVILTSKPESGLTESDLAPLVGKKIRISGKLNLRPADNTRRPEIRITNRAAIHE
ncbi:MAG: hypothetical protein ABI162_15085 [Luteolibacter sp.]